VAKLPDGYREVPEEDRKKAQTFFTHGKAAEATGNFDYAIEMYLQGLRLDPDSVPAHRELRNISLKRKASGGKAIGMFDAMKLKKVSKDDKENLLNSEKLLSFDPGNMDHMLSIAQNALRAGYFDSVLWIGEVLMRANAENPKPERKKFLALKDIYKKLEQYKLASDAAQFALRLQPDDMELQTEAKNLAAMDTVSSAGYDKKGSFRDQVRDMKAQLRLLDSDKEVPDSDAVSRRVADAEKELAADPDETGKATKLLDLLAGADNDEFENKGIALAQQWYEKTKQFRFRQRMGQIKIKQMSRHTRAAPASEREEATRKQFEFELTEYGEWAVNYPTNMEIRFEMGRRQFFLKKYDDAISSFQHAREDPKWRVSATILLGRSFYENGFLEEADETLGGLIRDYPTREGDRFKEMNYWRGRVLEDKAQLKEAVQHFSAVMQLESAYKDVAVRIKKLREQLRGGAAGGTSTNT
jgi:tetratricopeptide (TPR) repeat protein